MAVVPLRSVSFTSTKCGGSVKVKGILAEGTGEVRWEEGRRGGGGGWRKNIQRKQLQSQAVIQSARGEHSLSERNGF